MTVLSDTVLYLRNQCGVRGKLIYQIRQYRREHQKIREHRLYFPLGESQYISMRLLEDFTDIYPREEVYRNNRLRNLRR